MRTETKTRPSWSRSLCAPTQYHSKLTITNKREIDGRSAKRKKQTTDGAEEFDITTDSYTVTVNKNNITYCTIKKIPAITITIKKCPDIIL
jgi:hypothetical protein